MSSELLGLTEFQLLDMSKKYDSVVICDLRKKEDFAKGHIKNSIMVAFDEEKLLDVPKNSKVVLVGYDEEQSKQVATALRARNIEAYYLIGGISGFTSGLYCTNIFYVGTGYP